MIAKTYAFSTRGVFPQALTYQGLLTDIVGQVLGPSLTGKYYRIEVAGHDGERTRALVSRCTPTGEDLP